MERLKKIISACKNSVSISINQHRDYYESVAEYIEGMESGKNIAGDVFKKMVETDTIVQVQFYPCTPMGFYCIYHYDLDMALDIALGCLMEEGLV